MKISVVAVGKVKDAPTRALLDDYKKRIGRYVNFEEVELKDAKDSEVASQMLRHKPLRGWSIALEVTGKTWSSEQLSAYIAGAANQSLSELVFYIGGSYGLPSSISKGADVQLSLSKFTYPHKLARIVLFEQLYRAHTILRNEPYSH